MTATATHFNSRTGRSQGSTNTCEAIRGERPFKSSTGFLSGHPGNYGLRDGHRLNAAERAEYERVANNITYTVLSYETPIAWVYRADANGEQCKPGEPASQEIWHVVNQKFSYSTTRHQTTLWAALSGNFGDYSKQAYPISHEEL